jgi:catechol 2,3-dioxygenase-like lactoylglutathione lyase family enzyme
MATKNALHSVGTADLEQESGSLIIESKMNSPKPQISNKMILFSSLSLAAYTLVIVMITWAATKANSNNSNDNNSSTMSVDDDELYPDTILRRIDHGAVMAPNVTEARAWYAKFFDLRRKDCPGSCTSNYMINDMGVKFGVIPMPVNYTWVAPTLNGYKLAHFGIQVRTEDDYVTFRTRLLDGGVTIQGEHHYPDRSQSMYFLDLNGYGWEICCYTDNDLSIFI